MEAAASIPAKMPHVNTLRESVKKAREWVTRAHKKAKKGTEEADNASDNPKDSSDSTDSQDEAKVNFYRI